MRARLVVLFLLLVPATAHAADGESWLSITPGVCTWAVNQGQDGIEGRGGNLFIEYERGINDTLWFRAAGGGGIYTGAGTMYSGNGVVGVTYAWDVLKYLPWVNLGVGAMYLRGGDVKPGTRTLIELGFGADILRSRDFSYGFAVRFDSFASEIVYLSLSARLTWRWGYF